MNINEINDQINKTMKLITMVSGKMCELPCELFAGAIGVLIDSYCAQNDVDYKQFREDLCAAQDAVWDEMGTTGTGV